jgi:hypothetical protein
MHYAYSGIGAGEVAAGGGIIGGIGSVLGAIVEPLALGGVMAYQTYATDKAQTRDLKARRVEAAQIAEIRAREAKLQAELATQMAPIRAEQFKLVAGGLALVGAVGLAGWLAFKVRKKK